MIPTYLSTEIVDNILQRVIHNPCGWLGTFQALYIEMIA